jgi:hypothetical protein
MQKRGIREVENPLSTREKTKRGRKANIKMIKSINKKLEFNSNSLKFNKKFEFQHHACFNRSINKK